MIVLYIVYNKERRKSLREKYEDESEESRQRGVAIVVLYEILSFVFVFCVFMADIRRYNASPF